MQSEDGDIIDCVNIYQQPAFDHPALKNHTIQKIPTFLKESHSNSQDYLKISQTWQKSGSCPKGTIPIRRILKKDLLRAASLNRFGIKPVALLNNSTNTSNFNGSLEAITNSHSGAHLQTSGSNFIGADGNINIWNPKIELDGDSSTAQIWLKAGNGLDFESIEAGWMVNPNYYGNNDTRLFAYWTSDSYKTTGCFDLTCSGFVQTNNEFTLGGAITPISSDNGEQFELNIGIHLDELGHWWLKINRNVPIGYWPAGLFVSLKHSAVLVQWGGEVFSSKVRTSPPHTGTWMGSGYTAEDGFGHACFIRNIRIRDYSLQVKYPDSISIASQEPYCYSVFNDDRGGKDPEFYFGGSGRSVTGCF
ncbi:hypothetical protein KIW84_011843 [Lathyrus oleraceus]|uniref:Neprosin PEP catalytic domain-containing protein n=1 Tax=Pisum sativum TaxID=3888 RepID=A0A9D5BG21_PEA|nr:hypothetical protein KIW84_011843 [Pisum sativum]